MQDIDFLPADFKQRRTNRHGRSWQVVVAVAAAALLVLIAVGQHRAYKQIQNRLAEIEPERQILDARQAQLADLRKQLTQAEALAELHAYMDHPWPKTQLLAVTFLPLPDAVSFDRIRITHEPINRGPQRRMSETEEEDASKLEPATRDLRLLRQEYDFAIVTIGLEGATTDGIELHRYLDRLNHAPLLDKVELQNLEAANSESNAGFHFEARLTVRPGFGQPNGPDGRSPHLAGITPPQTVASEPQP